MKKNNIILQIAFMCISLVVLYGCSPLTKSYDESGKIIDMCIAHQLKKDVYKLTDEDYQRIETLVINGLIDKPIYTRKTFEKVNEEALDLRPLLKLQNLRKLEIERASINNFKPLAEIKSLGELYLRSVNSSGNDLSNNRITNKVSSEYIRRMTPVDLSTLKHMKHLELLSIISDTLNTDTIADLKNLKSLVLYSNTGNISFLENLINLEYLGLHGIEIQNIEPLSNLRNLKQLNIGNTKVKDFSPLEKLNNLEILKVSNSNEIDKQIQELQKALPDLKIVRLNIGII